MIQSDKVAESVDDNSFCLQSFCYETRHTVSLPLLRFISYAVRKPARLVLQDECGRDPIPKGWETPFGEEQHSSGNGNQTAAPRFLMVRIPKACAPSASGKEDRTADSRKYPVTYCVTGCAAV